MVSLLTWFRRWNAHHTWTSGSELVWERIGNGYHFVESLTHNFYVRQHRVCSFSSHPMLYIMNNNGHIMANWYDPKGGRWNTLCAWINSKWDHWLNFMATDQWLAAQRQRTSLCPSSYTRLGCDTVIIVISPSVSFRQSGICRLGGLYRRLMMALLENDNSPHHNRFWWTKLSHSRTVPWIRINKLLNVAVMFLLRHIVYPIPAS